jgi:hypothetical protein
MKKIHNQKDRADKDTEEGEVVSDSHELRTSVPKRSTIRRTYCASVTLLATQIGPKKLELSTVVPAYFSIIA